MKKYESGHTPSSLSFDSSVSFWNSSSSPADKHSSSRSFCGERSETRETIMSQAGRSMVEILGVIAIIGVLTLGGLIGFKYAMDKYIANEIANEARLRASDIFHKYQVMNLPDVGTFQGYENCTNDFSEWPSDTKTGYTINTCAIKDSEEVDIAFAIAVKDVHKGVCERLVEMKPQEYLEGFRYMLVDGVRYWNDETDICNADVQDVIFVMLLDGEIAECTGDECGEACVLDSDCRSLCNCAICDKETLTCALPFTAEGIPQVCNNGFCEPTRECQPGTGFRIASGVCVPCTDNSDYALDPDDEVFRVEKDGVVLIEDSMTPSGLCTECRNGHRVLNKDNPGPKRCYVDCPLGYGYTPSGGFTGGTEFEDADYQASCIPCDKDQDYPIVGETAKAACKACGNYVFSRATWTSNQNIVMCGTICSDDEFKGTLYANGGGHRGGDCYRCDTHETPILFPNGTSATGTIDHQALCTACGRSIVRWGTTKFCIKMDMCETDEFLKAPYLTDGGDNVFRKAECVSCSKKAPVMIWKFKSVDGGSNDFSEFDEICTACGNRKVVVDEQGDRWCVLTEDTICAPNQFLDSSGTCRDCSEESAYIVSEAFSKCEAVCNGESVDLDGDGIAETVKTKRRRVVSTLGDTLCLRECADGQVQGTNGKCYDCDSNTSVNVGFYTKLREECTDNCKTTITKENGEKEEVSIRYVATSSSGQYCKKIPTCADDEFLDANIVCQKCSAEGYFRVRTVDGFEQCNSCQPVVGKNQDRTYYPNERYCTLVNPGVSGSCNSLGDYEGNNPYPDGDGKWFRASGSGRCISCDSEADVSVLSYTNQCATCGDMRVLSGSTCQLNRACSEGASFWNDTTKRCMLCTAITEAKNKNIHRYKTTYEKQGLCVGCGLRSMQVKEINSETKTTTDTYYCAKTCAPDHWQDEEGNCIACDSDNTTGNYIGWDVESRSLCTACGRTVKEDAGRYQCVK